METRNELMIYAGKDDYTGRRDGRCAHPNTVRGRVAPRKVEVHGSACTLLAGRKYAILGGTYYLFSRRGWTLSEPIGPTHS